MRRKSDEAFAKAWNEALDLSLGALEDEAMSRAFDRNDKASHLLLMFMLKALRPKKYRENPKPLPVAPRPEPMDNALLKQVLITLPPEMLAHALGGYRHVQDGEAIAAFDAEERCRVADLH